MRHVEDSLATILLVSRLSSDGLLPLKAAEFWKLCDHIGKPSALLGQAADDLTKRHGLASELSDRIVALLDRATAVAFELERLDQSGLSVLSPFDDHYPQRFIARLGTKAPPVLYAAGAVELLDHPGLGVVGSREVSPDGGEIAKAAAAHAARLGLALVSGGARGVDQLAMNAAFQAGGTVIGILADSLVRTLKSPDVRRAIHGGTTVMCTPYSPDAPFSTGNAMGRNKLVYAQSVVTVVVASEADKGGTWSGAVEALRGRFGRVVVWRGPGEGPGNQPLQDKGASPITSMDALDELLARPEPEQPIGQSLAVQASAVQTSLFPHVERSPNST